MVLLDPTYIRDNCDYSFGDLSGIYTGGEPLYGAYFKDANINNKEFIDKYNLILKERNYMTLFIDNIRLYKRNVKYSAVELTNEYSRQFKDKIVTEHHSKSDLLELCSELKDMNFIIFTAFDDSPIDEEIFNKIPNNVLSIFASNAITFGGKVIPIPYGIKRKFSIYDDKQEILKSIMYDDFKPKKLLYLNHNISNNPNRGKLNIFFQTKDWATVKNNTSGYENFLIDIKNHKFMICPDGNAIGCECHRDWEVLYMRRVPIVKKTEYLLKIFENFPVLFVDNFEDVNQDLLENNEHLYEEVLKLDFKKLDFKLLFENYIDQTIKKHLYL